MRKTIHCVDVRWKECTYVSAPLAVVLTLILCFEALLFLLFTAIMFCTQMHAISVDETGIEQLKGEKNLGNKSKWANFKQVFGYQPTWTWFLRGDFYHEIHTVIYSAPGRYITTSRMYPENPHSTAVLLSKAGEASRTVCVWCVTIQPILQNGN